MRERYPASNLVSPRADTSSMMLPGSVLRGVHRAEQDPTVGAGASQGQSETSFSSTEDAVRMRPVLGRNLNTGEYGRRSGRLTARRLPDTYRFSKARRRD